MAITVQEATAKINGYYADPRRTAEGQSVLFHDLQGLSPEQLTEAFKASNYLKGMFGDRGDAINKAVANVQAYPEQEAKKAQQDAIWAKVEDGFTSRGTVNRGEPEKLKAAFEAVKDVPESELKAALKAHVKGSDAASFVSQANKYNTDPQRTIEARDRQIEQLKTQVQQAQQQAADIRGQLEAVRAPQPPAVPQEGQSAAPAQPVPTQAQPAQAQPAQAQPTPAQPANKINPDAIKQAVGGIAPKLKNDKDCQTVAKVQAMLKVSGLDEYKDIKVDGTVGPETRKALEKLKGTDLSGLSEQDRLALKEGIGELKGVHLSLKQNKDVKENVTHIEQALTPSSTPASAQPQQAVVTPRR